VEKLADAEHKLSPLFESFAEHRCAFFSGVLASLGNVARAALTRPAIYK
jgi:hypothetical protein